MSMGAKVAVISFPIKLVAGDAQGGEETTTGINESEIDDAIQSAVDDATEDAIDEFSGVFEGIDPEALEGLKDFLENTDKQGMQTLSKFAKNPQGAVQNELLGLLGKAGIHGAIAVAIISLIVASPELVKTIVNALAIKGGPLNQDFHRFFEDEGQLGFSRELQYRLATGLDVVITNDQRGFLLTDPGFVSNSLVDVDSTRAIRNSSQQNKYGYVTGM